MGENSLILKNGIIVTMDNQRRIIKGRTVIIEGDTIIDIVQSSARRYKGDKEIDCKNKIINYKSKSI